VACCEIWREQALDSPASRTMWHVSTPYVIAKLLEIVQAFVYSFVFFAVPNAQETET